MSLFKEHLSAYQFILLKEIRNQPNTREGLFLTGKLAIVKEVQKLLATIRDFRKSNVEITVKIQTFLDETRRQLRKQSNRDSAYIDGKVSMSLLLLEKIDELRLILPTQQPQRHLHTRNTPTVIGELRQKSGLTQQELAELSGVHPWTISMAERGHMSFRTATKIAKVFNVSIEEISQDALRPIITPKYSNGITERRTKQGMSKTELAKQCGLSIATLTTAENGEATERTMRKISAVFGVPIEELSHGIKIRTFKRLNSTNPSKPRRRNSSVIANLRTSRNMTQQKLAELCNVNRQVIYLAEKGKASKRSLTAIAHALNVPVETVSEGIVTRKPFSQKSAIIKLRKERHMSKRKLAKQCGVNAKTITSAERGRARTKTLVKIAAALDVPIEVIAQDITATNRRQVNFLE